MSIHSNSGHPATMRHALVVSALWLLAGFLGVSMVAAGLLQARESEKNAMLAVLFVFGGSIVTTTSWRRGLRAVECVDDASITTEYAPTTPPPRPASEPGVTLSPNPATAL